jgi:hypothetical protein
MQARTRLTPPSRVTIFRRPSFAAAAQSRIVRIVLVIAIALLLGDLLRQATFIDTEAYYDAGLAIRHGERLYEKDLAWAEHGWATVGPNQAPPGANSYSYAPAMAFLLAPLTYLPVDAVNALWFGLIAAALLLAMKLLCSLVAPAPANVWLGASCVALLTAPVRATLLSGNCDLLLLLALALALHALVNQRPGQMATWIVFAAVVKPPLLLLLVPLLWLREYRVFALASIAVALLIFAPFFALGSETFTDWRTAGEYWSSPAYLVSPSTIGVYGALLRHLTQNQYVSTITDDLALAKTLYGVALAASALLVAWMALKFDTRPASNRALFFGITVVVVLLVSPITELGHLVILAVPLCIIGYFAEGRGDWLTHGLVTALLLLIYPPLVMAYLFCLALFVADLRRWRTLQPLLILSLLVVDGLLLWNGIPRTNIDFSGDLPISGWRAVAVEINLVTLLFVATLLGGLTWRLRPWQTAVAKDNQAAPLGVEVPAG